MRHYTPEMEKAAFKAVREIVEHFTPEMAVAASKLKDRASGVSEVLKMERANLTPQAQALLDALDSRFYRMGFSLGNSAAELLESLGGRASKLRDYLGVQANKLSNAASAASSAIKRKTYKALDKILPGESTQALLNKIGLPADMSMKSRLFTESALGAGGLAAGTGGLVAGDVMLGGSGLVPSTDYKPNVIRSLFEENIRNRAWNPKDRMWTDLKNN